MPYYRLPGGVMAHLKLSGPKKKWPKQCPFWRWAYSQGEGGVLVDRVLVRCLSMCQYECDWPGCNAPFCEAHRLNLGDNLDVCPTHNHKRGLFSRLLPAPETAWKPTPPP